MNRFPAERAVGEVDGEVVRRPRAVEVVHDLRQAPRWVGIGVGGRDAVAAGDRDPLAEIVIGVSRQNIRADGRGVRAHLRHRAGLVIAVGGPQRRRARIRRVVHARPPARQVVLVGDRLVDAVLRARLRQQTPENVVGEAVRMARDRRRELAPDASETGNWAAVQALAALGLRRLQVRGRR